MDTVTITIPTKTAQVLAALLEWESSRRTRDSHISDALTTRALDLLPAHEALTAALQARRFRVLSDPDIRPAAVSDDLPPAA